MDNIESLRREDWERVICVFALGAEWQFKGWPREWNGPADYFAHVKGFHLMFEDEKVDENIKRWNVSILKISKNQLKRHLDAVAVKTFWETLDLFVAKNKPELLNL